MFLNKLFTSILRRQTATVLGACYDDCNHAAIEAEAARKSSSQPSACEPNSALSISIRNCQACVGSKNGNSSLGDVKPAFQQFLDFCANVTGTDETLVAKVASYQSAISSLTAVSASLANDRALLGITSTAADNTTTRQTSAKLTSSIPLNASPSPTSATSSSSKGTGEITGAAAGSIVGGAAALLAVGYFILRRRRRRRLNAESVSSDKPMLHSDDFKPDRKELSGDMPTPKGTNMLWSGSIAEMPANEIPGTELDASNAQDDRPTGGQAT